MAGILDRIENALNGTPAGPPPEEAWRTALKTAQYGKAFFKYQSHTRSGGHRVNVIDYPESAQHDLEDMGPNNDSFQISGYVIGENFIEDRATLLSELKDSAVKNLTIPTEGTFRVKCTDWSISETKEEQRISRFSMTFQLKEEVEILTVGDTKAALFEAKEGLLDKIADFLEAAYKISQYPVTAVNDVTSTIDLAINVVRDVKKVTGSVADFQRAVGELKGRLIALTLNGRSIAQDLGGLINFGTDPSRLGTTVESADQISLDTTGTQQRIEMKNLQSQLGSPLVPNAQQPSPLVQNTLSMLSIAAETGLVAVSEFDSPQQAIEEERDLISRYDDLIDSLLVDVENEKDVNIDDLYYAIRTIQKTLHDDLQRRVITLPRLVTRKNDAERNALELNYSNYGDLDEYESFNLRNSIIHPGFIPASIDLKYKVRPDE